MPTDDTQLETRLPPPRPFKCKPQIWQGYCGRELDIALATVMFRARFGYEPLSVQETDGALLLERRPDDEAQAIL